MLPTHPRPAHAPVNTCSAVFRTWFAASKLVDREGQPLRLYHATIADIGQFAFETRQYAAIRVTATPEGALGAYIINKDGSEGRAPIATAIHAGQRWFCTFGAELRVMKAKTSPEAKAELRRIVNPRMPVSERVFCGRRFFFFSAQPDYAERQFARDYESTDPRTSRDHMGATYPVYLRIENPALPTEEHWNVVRDFFHEWRQADRTQGVATIDMDLAKQFWLAGRWEVKEARPHFSEFLASRGFDGFLSYEGTGTAWRSALVDGIDPSAVHVWAALDPCQVQFALTDTRPFRAANAAIPDSAETVTDDIDNNDTGKLRP